MSQGEVVRLSDLGLSSDQVATRLGPVAKTLAASGNNAERRARLIELMRTSHGITVGVCGLEESLNRSG